MELFHVPLSHASLMESKCEYTILDRTETSVRNQVSSHLSRLIGNMLASHHVCWILKLSVSVTVKEMMPDLHSVTSVAVMSRSSSDLPFCCSCRPGVQADRHTQAWTFFCLNLSLQVCWGLDKTGNQAWKILSKTVCFSSLCHTKTRKSTCKHKTTQTKCLHAENC